MQNRFPLNPPSYLLLDYEFWSGYIRWRMTPASLTLINKPYYVPFENNGWCFWSFPITVAEFRSRSVHFILLPFPLFWFHKQYVREYAKETGVCDTICHCVNMLHYIKVQFAFSNFVLICVIISCSLSFFLWASDPHAEIQIQTRSVDLYCDVTCQKCIAWNVCMLVHVEDDLQKS